MFDPHRTGVGAPRRRSERPRPIPPRRRHDRIALEYARPVRVLDAVYREPSVQGRAAPARIGEGDVLHIGRRPTHSRRHRRALVRERRPLPRRDRRGDRRAGGRDGFRADVPDGAPEGVRGRDAHRASYAGQSEARVLHELRLRSGRYRAEDRARVSPRARRSAAHALHRPRARLSRRRLRRHLGRRHRAEPQGVFGRAAAGGRPSAAYAEHRRSRVFERAACVGRASRGRTRANRRVARRLDDRRGDRRTGRRLGRRADSAAGLSRAAARAMRPLRHPADLRRGDHGLGGAWARRSPRSSSA